MATNMTIKRYTGTEWVEYAPSTVIAQVDGLQTALDAKEVSNNKITSFVTTGNDKNIDSDVKYPSAKLVYDNLVNVREVAAGLTASRVTDAIAGTGSVKNILCGASEYSTGTSATITASTTGVTPINANIGQDTFTITVTERYLYLLDTTNQGLTYYVKENLDLTKIKVGDILYISDINVPDYWFKGSVTANNTTSYVFSKLETSKVPLTDYVPKTRTINSKALSSDITLSASDVGALASDTVYFASASVDGNTLTLTPSTGSAVTYTPTIPTNYLSGTPSAVSDSSSSTCYIVGKDSTGTSTNNYVNSKVYFKGDDLYATTFNASNSLQLDSLSTADSNGLSNKSGDLYWKATKVVTGNYLKSVSASNNVLTITNQGNTDTTFTNTTSYVGSSTPSNAHTGDIWFVTAS